nr:hypothetical protein [Microctonus hyperodae filamentous virus]
MTTNKNILFGSVLHGEKRNKVLQTHYKYLRYLNDGTRQDVENLIFKFILDGKSMAYCKAILSSCVNYLIAQNPQYKKPYYESLILSTYKRAKKISEIPTRTIMYDKDNNQVDGLMTMQKKLLKNGVNMGTIKHLPTQIIQQLYTYSKTVVENFFSLPKTTTPVSIEIEHALLIVLLTLTGMRKGELLKMTRKNVVELLSNGGNTELCTKTGRQIVSMGQKSRTYLQKYLAQVSASSSSSITTFLFSHTYKALRQQHLKIYKKLFDKAKPRGALFHVFRSNFSALGSAKNSLLTQQLLNHTSYSTTDQYKKNQLLNDTTLRQVIFNHVEAQY